MTLDFQKHRFAFVTIVDDMISKRYLGPDNLPTPKAISKARLRLKNIYLSGSQNRVNVIGKYNETKECTQWT